jgi:hypothetical protein
MYAVGRGLGFAGRGGWFLRSAGRSTIAAILKILADAGV